MKIDVSTFGLFVSAVRLLFAWKKLPILTTCSRIREKLEKSDDSHRKLENLGNGLEQTITHPEGLHRHPPPLAKKAWRFSKIPCLYPWFQFQSRTWPPSGASSSPTGTSASPFSSLTESGAASKWGRSRPRKDYIVRGRAEPSLGRCRKPPCRHRNRRRRRPELGSGQGSSRKGENNSVKSENKL